MKKSYIILMFCIILSLFGCGKVEDIGKDKNAVSSEQSGSKKEIYWERTENLGLQKESVIRLESMNDNSGASLVIDDFSVSLGNEKGIAKENYNFTKMLKQDFDKDGIMEIVLLFFGGSSGTFQNFRVIKFDKDKWEIVPMDFDDVGDSALVTVKALKSNQVQISVKDTGYNETIKLSKKKYSVEGEVTMGVGYRFFELQGDDIVVAYRLYIDNVGNSFGDVRQKIQFDKSGSKLILGETGYMTIEEAKNRPYEVL